MLKHLELSSPTSCLNKALSDEPIFVLRANDELAAPLIRLWAARYHDLKMNEVYTTPPERVAQIVKKHEEAYALARMMDEWRAANGIKPTPQGGR
jgi:hypothetical protein